MNHEEEEPEVYYIPSNYDDGGSVLGGRMKTRNCIELVLICGPIAFLEYKLLRFSMQTNIIIFLCTLVPLAALCVFGIADQSLFQAAWAVIRFFSTNERLSYDLFTDPTSLDHESFSIDRFFDSVSTSGMRNALKKMSEERSNSKAAKQEKQDEKDGKKPKKPKKEKKKRFGRKKTKEEEEDEQIRKGLRQQEREIGNQTKGWLSRAKQVRDQSRFSRGR